MVVVMTGILEVALYIEGRISTGFVDDGIGLLEIGTKVIVDISALNWVGMNVFNIVSLIGKEGLMVVSGEPLSISLVVDGSVLLWSVDIMMLGSELLEILGVMIVGSEVLETEGMVVIFKIGIVLLFQVTLIVGKALLHMVGKMVGKLLTSETGS